MQKIGYTPSLFRQLKKLSPELREEIFEKIELFKNKKNHSSLKVYRLKGKLAGKFTFSANYKTRIVFVKKNDLAILVSVGDYDVYK